MFDAITPAGAPESLPGRQSQRAMGNVTCQKRDGGFTRSEQANASALLQRTFVNETVSIGHLDAETRRNEREIEKRKLLSQTEAGFCGLPPRWLTVML